MLPYISRSKSNYVMKTGQVIEHNNKNIFLQKSFRKCVRETSSRPLFIIQKSFILTKSKKSAVQFQYMRQSIKTSCMKLQGIDRKVSSIQIFQKRACEQILHRILRMIFQEKCFSYYILLTDQISLPDCLYFLRYWYVYCNCLLTRL